MRFRVIDGCPVPAAIAPYVYLVLRRAGQSASSIYRGEDPAARPILRAHGKHTQREIYEDPAYRGMANPPGRSQHELRSDGFANAGPVGRYLEAWQIGVDSGGDDPASKLAVRRAAEHFGWSIEHPYSRGVEGHHWCFARRPRPNRHARRWRIMRLRATLPRR